MAKQSRPQLHFVKGSGYGQVSVNMTRVATFIHLSPLLVLFMLQAQGKPHHPTWTNPEKAAAENADFLIQGEYRDETMGAQVVALGAGAFDVYLLEGGLPGAGWEPGNAKHAFKGIRQGEKREEKGFALLLETKGLSLTVDDKTRNLSRIIRESPTLGKQSPDGAIVLFDGTNADEWENGKVVDGHLQATNTTSRRLFGDYRLHLEFRTPYMPTARGQARGNSGIYHSGRWETQILDSFGLEGRENETGGIYSVAKPRLNMCLPPLAWQTYDVDFTAAKFDAEGKRTAWPRITVRLNGVLVHEDLELTKDNTAAAPLNQALTSPEGPIFLQNHGNPVEFRNIWITPGQ
jgi:hypothetical protein